MKPYKILFAFAALTFYSCVIESETSFPSEGDDKSVRFSLSITRNGEAGADSRAMTSADENTINTIDVLAFYRDGEGVYRYAYTAANIHRTDMAVTATVKGYSAPQQFVVVVNASEELAGADIVLNESLEGAMRKLVCTKGVQGQWKAANNGDTDFDYIPMYAKTDPVVVDAHGKQIGTFPLIRMTARIDVRVRSGLSNFILTDARLFNQKTAGYVAYDFSDFQTDRAYSAAVPAANTTTGDPVVSGTVAYEADYEDDEKGVIERAIYTYESPAYDESGRLTGTAIVVGGEYNGTLGYYRINLKMTDDGNESRLSSHILRNHCYKVEIQSVSGPGYKTPEEAYIGDGRLEATVKEWTDMKQHVIGDGQWWLSVSENELHFTGEGGSAEITAESNYNTQKHNLAEGIWFSSSNCDWIEIEDVVGSDGDLFRTVKIEAYENTFESRNVKVYVLAGNMWKAINVYQSVHNVPSGESNCYMVNNNDIKPIVIPVSQLRYAMVGIDGTSSGNGYLGERWIEDYSRLKAQVLWSDVNNFGTSESVVESAVYNGGAESLATLANGQILVTPGKKAGNAGIILYEEINGTSGYQHNSTDRIRWSWHIWNTEYYPYEEDGTPNGKKTGNQNLTNEDWMDRNLGAMSNTPGDTKTNGFYYQWGRKDPFPNTGATPIYYTAGSFTKSSFTASPNLSNAVLNPLIFYYNATNPHYNWYCPNNAVNRNDDLWGGGATTSFLHSNGKSVYDPCPVGYRLPAVDEWKDDGLWVRTPSYGLTNNNYGGLYSVAGRLKASNGSFEGSGTYAYYWSSTPLMYYAEHRGGMLNFNNLIYKLVLPGYDHRAVGANVRCRKE